MNHGTVQTILDGIGYIQVDLTRYPAKITMKESWPHDTLWKRDNHKEPNWTGKRNSSTGTPFHGLIFVSNETQQAGRTSTRNISVLFLLKSSLRFVAGHARTILSNSNNDGSAAKFKSEFEGLKSSLHRRSS